MNTAAHAQGIIEIEGYKLTRKRSVVDDTEVLVITRTGTVNFYLCGRKLKDVKHTFLRYIESELNCSEETALKIYKSYKADGGRDRKEEGQNKPCCMECGQASTVDNPIRNYHNPDWLHGSAKQILAAHITRCETCYTHSIAAQELWPVECDCYEEEGDK